MTPEELERRLKQFQPVQARFRYKTGLLYSPGIQFLIDEANAVFLVAVIANEQYNPILNENSELQQFQNWEFSTRGKPYLRCFRSLEEQFQPVISIPLWKDSFPLEFLRLLCVDGVLMLASECSSL